VNDVENSEQGLSERYRDRNGAVSPDEQETSVGSSPLVTDQLCCYCASPLLGTDLAEGIHAYHFSVGGGSADDDASESVGR
jgi:hypothetical protein